VCSARQARRAATDLPAQFTAAVGALQEDFGAALGISFEGEEGEEGEHFFRSSLLQTVYYGIFAGWLLHAREWRPIPADAYDWRRTGDYLRIPFLAGLFHDTEAGERGWFEFLGDLGYAENWQPRGWYRPIADHRFQRWGGPKGYLTFLRNDCGFGALEQSF
jgi:hypothetical protein